MQRHGVHVTESELNQLASRFDRFSHGSITYQEFMDEMLEQTCLLPKSS